MQRNLGVVGLRRQVKGYHLELYTSAFSLYPPLPLPSELLPSLHLLPQQRLLIGGTCLESNLQAGLFDIIKLLHERSMASRWLTKASALLPVFKNIQLLRCHCSFLFPFFLLPSFSSAFLHFSSVFTYFCQLPFTF